MPVTRPIIVAVAFATLFSSAFAQSNTNAQRCQDLSQEVTAEFQRSVQARVPKTDPSTFNQSGYDIKGIMAQDVGTGFGKLGSLDFSGVINAIVNAGVAKANQSAVANFGNRVNETLAGFGISGVNIKASGSGVGITTPTMGNVVTGAVNGAVTTIGNNVKKVGGPYGRP